MNKAATFGLGAALLLAAAPASAVTTFASFSPSSNQPNVFYNGSPSGDGTATSVSQLVNFTFLNPDGSTGGTTFDAWMNLTATTGVATTVGNLAVLPVISGTLSFTALSPVTLGGHTGTNLLTANFSGGWLTTTLGGSTANYGVSTPPYTVDFTSSFLDFSGSTTRDLSLAVDAINPNVGILFGGRRIHAGTMSGLFGADISAGLPQGAVPEPASWALMCTGFGLIGSLLRSQRRRPEVTFA